MKITKQKDPRYPIVVWFSDGRYLQLVQQSKLKDGTFLRQSGCSILSEYEALQWLGRHDKDIMPSYLTKWHRANTPKDIHGKLTVKGVNKGLAHFGKGYGTGKYYKPSEITLNRVKKFLRAGCLIIFEHKAPHTFLLAYDDGKYWLLDKGKCEVANLPVLVARKNKTATYGGMVVITPTKKVEKKPTTTPTKAPAKAPTKTPSKPNKKTNAEIAKEVAFGKWGNGEERKKKLTAAGYDYRTIQNLVNKLLKK